MLSDSLFSDAGWLFFVIWSIVVGIFSVAAFPQRPAPRESPYRIKATSRSQGIAQACDSANISDLPVWRFTQTNVYRTCVPSGRNIG